MKIFFLSGFILLCLSLSAQDSSYSRTEIIYGRKDGMALSMVEMMPKVNAKGKAILSLVSGNWVSNYRMAPGFERQATTLVHNGFTVFLVMHSSAPRYAINDEISDIKRAVRFIRYHAGEYHIDADHIGITGSSSGGQLSLLTALSNDPVNENGTDPVDRVSSRVQAAAVFFPPTDFLNWGKANTGIDMEKLKMFGVAAAFDFKKISDSTGMYEHIKDTQTVLRIAREISPINFVSPDDPPVLITQGDADLVVPFQQSQIMIEKLKAAGVPCAFLLHPGGGHGWKNNDVEEQKFSEWFDRYLR